MANSHKLSRSIRGKVALITGAASGMGRATAILFAEEGAKVALADVNKDGLAGVEAEITKAGGAAKSWVLDVSNPARITKVVAEIVKHFGALDILVNNAGVSCQTPIDSDSFEADWERVIAIDLTAHARLIRAALPHIQKSECPRIVNVASTEGLGATARISPYTAAKHGVIGLTRSLAVEFGAQQITVNCVCPGPIRTGMTADIPEDHKTKFARRRVPLKRYGDPEEVAHATLSLVLPAASYINGAVLVVDGGMTAQNT